MHLTTNSYVATSLLHNPVLIHTLHYNYNNALSVHNMNGSTVLIAPISCVYVTALINMLMFINILISLCKPVA